MGTVIPIISSCSVCLLGTYLMIRSTAAIAQETSLDKYRNNTIVIGIGFILIMVSGIINKVME